MILSIKIFTFATFCPTQNGLKTDRDLVLVQIDFEISWTLVEKKCYFEKNASNVHEYFRLLYYIYAGQRLIGKNCKVIHLYKLELVLIE